MIQAVNTLNGTTVFVVIYYHLAILSFLTIEKILYIQFSQEVEQVDGERLCKGCLGETCSEGLENHQTWRSGKIAFTFDLLILLSMNRGSRLIRSTYSFLLV